MAKWDKPLHVVGFKDGEPMFNSPSLSPETFAEVRRYKAVCKFSVKEREDFEEMEQIAYRAALANGETFGLGGLDVGTPNRIIIEKYHKILEGYVEPSLDGPHDLLGLGCSESGSGWHGHGKGGHCAIRNEPCPISCKAALENGHLERTDLDWRKQKFERIINLVTCTRADEEPFAFRIFWQNSRMFLRVEVLAVDTMDTSGPKTLQKGRKWLLSEHMTVTEVVRTAWKAIEAFELHELQERFRYKGACVFNSHISVDELAKVAEKVDIRP
jgi:hypothetical protein